MLLWSQMHGDEPTATVALFDVLNYVRSNRPAPHVARLLDRLTLHVVPMLNPDGAEKPQRRNAQGIDINRDALLLQTPEGRALKALRDRAEPAASGSTSTTRTGARRSARPASRRRCRCWRCPTTRARSDNPGRILAKKVASVIRDAVEPLAPGMIGRYDDEFEVRAFGDNLTKWGTSVVLIETGPYPGPDPDRALVRMNFVALLTALDALASGQRRTRQSAARTRRCRSTTRTCCTRSSRAPSIAPGTGVAPFLGDIGIAASRVVREVDGVRQRGVLGADRGSRRPARLRRARDHRRHRA